MKICIKTNNMLPECSNAKNILRIYNSDMCQNLKITEAETEKHYCYIKNV